MAEDPPFLEVAEQGIRAALSTAAFDLAFYIAGADPFEGDRLGRLSVSKEGLRARDKLVADLCRRAGIPLAVVLGGGYAHDVTDTVDVHFNTVQVMAEFAEGEKPQA